MTNHQLPITNYHLFDRSRLRAHRARAAANFSAHDFLLREMVSRTCERLEEIKRTFPLALDIGAHNGMVAEILAGRGGVETLVQMEVCEPMLRGAKGLRVVADEEFLPFAENSLDLVISVGALHWVNDLPGALIQIQRILKPDGLFLAMMPGGQTLRELRAAFEFAEMEISGGVSPRVSPFVDVRDAGGLLQRAGFALPVVDSEIITVEYDHPLKLMKELRGMGEANALLESAKHFTPCATVMLAADYYMQHFANPEGRINATVELVTLTGWKPHASQQQPAKRGSGQVSLIKAMKD